MTVVEAYAPGKVILLGEHAVVYGFPAIALPLTRFASRAVVADALPGSGIQIVASDLDKRLMADAADEHPLSVAVRLALEYLGLGWGHDLEIEVSSTVPIGRGLGSGASVSTAIISSLVRYFGRDITADALSALVFEVEKCYHGTPSGIDNTVIAYEQAVFFRKNAPPEIIELAAPITLVLGDTGVVSETRQVVMELRRRLDARPDAYRPLLSQIGGLSELARVAVEGGDLYQLGRLMDENHKLLVSLGVSSVELDRLAAAARAAGARGAKMSGAGWGGHVVALVEPTRAADVAAALQAAGAVHTFITTVAR